MAAGRTATACAERAGAHYDPVVGRHSCSQHTRLRKVRTKVIDKKSGARGRVREKESVMKKGGRKKQGDGGRRRDKERARKCGEQDSNVKCVTRVMNVQERVPHLGRHGWLTVRDGPAESRGGSRALSYGSAQDTARECPLIPPTIQTSCFSRFYE